jgi:hypothetical protein
MNLWQLMLAVAAVGILLGEVILYGSTRVLLLESVVLATSVGIGIQQGLGRLGTLIATFTAHLGLLQRYLWENPADPVLISILFYFSVSLVWCVTQRKSKRAWLWYAMWIFNLVMYLLIVRLNDEGGRSRINLLMFPTALIWCVAQRKEERDWFCYTMWGIVSLTGSLIIVTTLRRLML